MALALPLVLASGTAAARFVSVDPVQADSSNGQNFNRYYYTNNNPYKFTDPDGRAVSLAGAPVDQTKFIQQTQQLTGTTVAPDSQGNLTIQSANSNVGSPGAAAALSNAINATQTISLTAVSSDPSVFIDSYATGKVDVDDIGNFAAASNDLGAAALTHVLTEYTTAMQAGGITQANFPAAHAAGLSAESAVMGATTRTSTSSSPTGMPTPGSNFGVQYQDASGATVRSYNFLLDQNGTP
ncbi:MAG TPA: hypothetical protein VF471_16650 [Pseudoxanthomonas sp.]